MKKLTALLLTLAMAISLAACGGSSEADGKIKVGVLQQLEHVALDQAREGFVKALEEDAYAFCERAKKYELLLVPSDDFGVKGYVRIAYCVSYEQIERSLPAFKKLYEEYKK